jgi:hypothetical protein
MDGHVSSYTAAYHALSLVPSPITHCKLGMDRASQVLARDLEPDEPRTYAALSKRGKVPRSTLWHRAHGRPSKEDKAKRQQ